jgi:2,3-dimethylmalate lyase
MNSSIEENRTKLKQRLLSDRQIIAPGIFDGLSARVADTVGFDVLYLSGYGVSASYLAKPDNGHLTAQHMQTRIESICEVTTTPIIADADTGFGDIADTVARYEKGGACGIQIEDQRVPKICGHISGREVIDRKAAIANIEQAVSARTSNDFLIVARTDAREQHGLAEAIARGQDFLSAGADVLFIESPESRDELAEIGEVLGHAPLLANMVEGGRTPLVSADELSALGFNFIIYPVAVLSVIAASMETSYRELLDGKLTADRLDFQKLSGLIGFERE